MNWCRAKQLTLSLVIAANAMMGVGCVVESPGVYVAPSQPVVVYSYYYYDPVMRVYYYRDPYYGWRYYPGRPPRNAHYWNGSRPYNLPPPGR